MGVHTFRIVVLMPAAQMDTDRLNGVDHKPLTSRVAYNVNPSREIVYICVVPWTVGRSFTDLLRILKALQVTYHHPVATPAEWLPGDKVFLTNKGKEIPEYTHMSQVCREYCVRFVPTLPSHAHAAHALRSRFTQWKDIRNAH